MSKLRHHLAVTLRTAGPGAEQLARDPAVQRALARCCAKAEPLSPADIEEVRRLAATIPREAPQPEIVRARQGSAEARARQSEAAKRRWSNPAEREKQRLAALRRATTAEGKKTLEKARRSSLITRGYL